LLIVVRCPLGHKLLFACRSLRLFAFGFLAVILVIYLTSLGYNESTIGLLFTLTLLGDGTPKWGRVSGPAWGCSRHGSPLIVDRVMFACVCSIHQLVHDEPRGCARPPEDAHGRRRTQGQAAKHIRVTRSRWGEGEIQGMPLGSRLSVWYLGWNDPGVKPGVCRYMSWPSPPWYPSLLLLVVMVSVPCGVMQVVTGLAFALQDNFYVLLVCGTIGVISPSGASGPLMPQELYLCIVKKHQVCCSPPSPRGRSMRACSRPGHLVPTPPTAAAYGLMGLGVLCGCRTRWGRSWPSSRRRSPRSFPTRSARASLPGEPAVLNGPSAVPVCSRPEVVQCSG
jgi:hypothetical protein